MKIRFPNHNNGDKTDSLSYMIYGTRNYYKECKVLKAYGYKYNIQNPQNGSKPTKSNLYLSGEELN